jgi:hypothetical protein
MRRFALAFALMLTACAAPARAQSDAVTIADAAWLEGHWVGEGFGGQLEEIWMAPVGAQMVGHFRMTQDGAPVFYEFLLIEEHEGGLRYRVKHFNPDMVGWEERDGFHEFPWVSASADELRFGGLVLRQVDAATSDHIITTRAADGAETTQTLRYRRAAD